MGEQQMKRINQRHVGALFIGIVASRLLEPTTGEIGSLILGLMAAVGAYLLTVVPQPEVKL